MDLQKCLRQVSEWEWQRVSLFLNTWLSANRLLWKYTQIYRLKQCVNQVSPCCQGKTRVKSEIVTNCTSLVRVITFLLGVKSWLRLTTLLIRKLTMVIVTMYKENCFGAWRKKCREYHPHNRLSKNCFIYLLLLSNSLLACSPWLRLQAIGELVVA